MQVTKLQVCGLGLRGAFWPFGYTSLDRRVSAGV